MVVIRRFKSEDAEAVSSLIRRNLIEVNTIDYPVLEMEILADSYNSRKVLNIAVNSHMYVAVNDNQIIGCGAISDYWGSISESIFLTIFVLPELHKKGIGRKIINALESDEYFLRANRIEIPSSITAYEFYHKLGYNYKDGKKELVEGHYCLEKFRLL